MLGDVHGVFNFIVDGLLFLCVHIVNPLYVVKRPALCRQ
jgi:hypothetical protein